MHQEGDRAPDFSLPDPEGVVRSLADFAGKKLVIYFYPEDDTPGCTAEACGFRDLYSEIAAAGAAIVGISPDSAESHRAFRGKYKLPFLLLADPDRIAIAAYGVWGEKNMYGKKVLGLIRSTYIVDERGFILKVFSRGKAEAHATKVLGFLRGQSAHPSS